MSTPQIALPGLEIDPGNGPIHGNYGQGAMETAIREAIAEIEADVPLTGVQRARKQQAISLAISIDRGNTKGRSIASDSERLDAVLSLLAPPVADDGPADDSHLTPETRRLLDALAAPAQLVPATERDGEGPPPSDARA